MEENSTSNILVRIFVILFTILYVTVLYRFLGFEITVLILLADNIIRFVNLLERLKR